MQGIQQHHHQTHAPSIANVPNNAGISSHQAQTQTHAQVKVDEHRSSKRHSSKKHSSKRSSLKTAKKQRKVGRWYLGETLGKGGYSWCVSVIHFISFLIVYILYNIHTHT